MLYNQRRRSANDTIVFQRFANVDTMLYNQQQRSANDTTIFQSWANVVGLSGRLIWVNMLRGSKNFTLVLKMVSFETRSNYKNIPATFLLQI